MLRVKRVENISIAQNKIAAALIILGYNSPRVVLYTLIAIAGATTIGSQILLYTFVAQHYQTAVRTTAMGWTSGIIAAVAIFIYATSDLL